jgi:hypothetical protein
MTPTIVLGYKILLGFIGVPLTVEFSIEGFHLSEHRNASATTLVVTINSNSKIIVILRVSGHRKFEPPSIAR